MAFVLAGGFKATNGSTRRSARVCASVSREVREAPLTLHTTDDTSIKILYPVAEGRVLIDAVNRLVTSFQTIKESAKRGERAREESLDYSLKNDNIKLEFHCNPNLFPDPIHAKVYITADDGRLSFSSTAMLPKIIDSLKSFKTQHQL
mmetsp:Transcript_6664/g.20188  ORF Transcript_6664/g.20188 Transcript_6664/m.20188 type:complete len:148 (+) Transcript_6664:93-536(+)